MKTASIDVEENGKKADIVERTVHYSLLIIKLYRELEKGHVGQILGKQLLRAGTSVGANVHEAQGGQSKADFISKMSIAYKEVREASYWLRVIESSNLISGSKLLSEAINETKQLVKILSSILLTSKQNTSNS